MVKFFFLLLRTVQLVLVPRQWLIGFCCTMGHHAGLLSIVLDFVLLGLNIIKIIITFIILVQVSWLVLPCFGLSLGGKISDPCTHKTKVLTRTLAVTLMI